MISHSPSTNVHLIVNVAGTGMARFNFTTTYRIGDPCKTYFQFRLIRFMRHWFKASFPNPTVHLQSVHVINVLQEWTTLLFTHSYHVRARIFVSIVLLTGTMLTIHFDHLFGVTRFTTGWGYDLKYAPCPVNESKKSTLVKYNGRSHTVNNT